MRMALSRCSRSALQRSGLLEGKKTSPGFPFRRYSGIPRLRQWLADVVLTARSRICCHPWLTGMALLLICCRHGATSPSLRSYQPIYTAATEYQLLHPLLGAVASPLLTAAVGILLGPLVRAVLMPTRRHGAGMFVGCDLPARFAYLARRGSVHVRGEGWDVVCAADIGASLALLGRLSRGVR